MGRITLALTAVLFLRSSQAGAQPKERDFPYFEMEGTVEDYQYFRDWRSYYWREDFTLVVVDKDGKRWRIISREPTPWTGEYRFGPTYTGLKVDWKEKPRVQIIGVQAVDRIPEEFHDLKLEPERTATAFIVRVRDEGQSRWEDYFVNNWFHHWGPSTDFKVLSHYAREEPRYHVCGYLVGIAAPFNAEGKERIEKAMQAYSGIIYRGHVEKAKNAVGYEVRLTHLVGRNKKTAEYEVIYGDSAKLARLDTRRP
jgi:hypothetical protein